MSFGFGFGFTKITAAIRAAFSPSSLFAANEPGVWYDPSDLSTLFQDAAGTTPVTAVEQPVGLMLDKSKRLVLGPELVTNGTFDTNISGWAASGSSPVISWQNGRLQVSGGGNAWAYTSFSVEIGKRYQITLDAFGGAYRTRLLIGPTSSTGYYYSEVSGGIVGDRQASATFVPTQNIAYIMVSSPTGAAVQFDNISVREILGNHASQPTATSRPVLSARYNLLTKTEQFDDAAWGKANVSVLANVITAPDGTNTADKLVGDTVNGLHEISNGSATTSGQTLTFSVYLKASEYSYAQILFGSTQTSPVGVYANFDLLNGAVTAGTAGDGNISSAGDGWWRCSVTVVTAGATLVPYVQLTPSGTSRRNAGFAGDGTSGIYIWGASLVPANQSSLPYQRVNTATDYDADPAKFKPYLYFDGVDDFLVTPTITPGIDKVQVFAGVRKLRDAQAVIAELSANVNTNTGVFGLFTGFPASTHYQFASKSTLASNVSIDVTSPVTNVVSGIGDISGDSAILRINGTQAAQNTSDQGTGNFLAYPLYIGRRGGTSLPFNGCLYSLIVRFGSNLPAATIEKTEKYINTKTRAY